MRGPSFRSIGENFNFLWRKKRVQAGPLWKAIYMLIVEKTQRTESAQFTPLQKAKDDVQLIQLNEKSSIFTLQTDFRILDSVSQQFSQFKYFAFQTPTFSHFSILDQPLNSKPFSGKHVSLHSRTYLEFFTNTGLQQDYTTIKITVLHLTLTAGSYV